MTLVAVQRGLLFPSYHVAAAGSATMDAATEKAAFIGRLYLNGRPTAAKTLSTGTIQYRTATVTFANGATTVDIGIQGVSTSAGPFAQPDGTYSVKTTLTGGGGGIAANAWNTATMNSGTVNLAHGDLLAVVFDMTARGGADSVLVTPGTMFSASSVSHGFPVTNAFVAGAWLVNTVGSGASRSPNVVIVFDDGTIGTIDGSFPFNTIQNESFQDSSSIDERGVLFQVPWDCKVDALWAVAGVTDASSDFTIKLYSDPTGTPTLLASIVADAAYIGNAGVSAPITMPLATEISLTRNTDYALAVLATGTSNTHLLSLTLGNTDHRVLLQGGTTLKKATRNNSSGAFTAESPAITMCQMGVRISQLHDGAGGVRPAGRGGLAG